MKCRTLVAWLALFGSLNCGAAGAQYSGAVPNQPYLSVAGTGMVQTPPDIAYVVVGVVTEARRASDASGANAAASQRIMAALRAQAIDARDLQTSDYSVQPEYKQNSSEQTIVGYRVTNQIRATVRKLDTVGKVIDAATEAGANSIQGVSFGLEDRKAAEDQALADAVVAAKRKAEVTARAAGLRLGPVMVIDASAEGPRPLVFGATMAGAGARPETPISAGELTVSATVTLQYRLLEGAARSTGIALEQRAALVAKRATLLAKYSPQHPEIQSLSAQIAELDKNISSYRRAEQADELARLKDERAALALKYSDRHPVMVALDEQIRSLRQKLGQAAAP